MTVMAGVPAECQEPTDWDRRSGFGSAPTAMRTRRHEDAVALSTLGGIFRMGMFVGPLIGSAVLIGAALFVVGYAWTGAVALGLAADPRFEAVNGTWMTVLRGAFSRPNRVPRSSFDSRTP